MGVDALLYRVRQQGTSPRRRGLEMLGSVADPDEVIAHLPQAHPGRFTSRIDPYGDAVVHGEEFQDFLGDLSAIRAVAAPADQPSLEALVVLVSEHVGERDVELHLLGD